VAHRWIYEQSHGPVVQGVDICHHCDNRLCDRNDGERSHLFAGTRKDNMRDMAAKGRGVTGDRHWLHREPERRAGIRNPLAKLSDDDVRTIRQVASTETSQRAIATQFGISQSTVSLIVNRKRWAHL